MNKFQVYNQDGKEVKQIDVNAALLEGPIRKGLLYYMVRYQLAKKRSGTHSTKTRGEVSGSTKKVYRQKGTGNARHGDRKAHIYVGGGVAFGPRPRDYSYEMPKSSKRRGLQTVIALKNREGRLKFIEAPTWSAPKSRQAAQLFQSLNADSALLVTESSDPVVFKSIRNLRKFKAIPVEGLNVYDILNYDHLIVTVSALDKLYQRLHLEAASGK